MTAPLPIDAVLDSLSEALDRGDAVLEAPPGAGKTTRVPLALLDRPWCRGRILMLEPRRVAARMAARRMAALRGEPVGATVGFRTRGESAISPTTRIEIVTEGVLTRMLQHDPSLPGVSLVIFDEFHERSLPGDLGLALVLGATRILRDDLRVLVMSATLDGDRIAGLLGSAPVIRSEGRQYPVERRFTPAPRQQSLTAHIAALVRDQVQQSDESILVFLSGMAEIERVATLLDDSLPANTRVYRLHGSLAAAMQDAAVAPATPGQRKVVLATNVAETSVTIEGIGVVIDSGWERISRFDPRTGMSRLETVRITRASADQRAGRAGRTGPGVALQCWSAADDALLRRHARAAIHDADLASLALDLAAAGFPDPAELPWLDPPPAAHYAVARELLVNLEVITPSGHLRDDARSLLDWGVTPRLAHMLARAEAAGPASVIRAARLAALIEQRDVLIGEGGPPPSDLQLRLDILERDGGRPIGVVVDRGAVAAVRDEARRLAARSTRRGAAGPDALAAGLLASWAWPDRVARRRGGVGRFVLRSGRGVSLPPGDPLAHAEWLVALEVDDVGREGRIRKAVTLDEDDVAALIAAAGETRDEVGWDATTRSVTIRRRTLLGQIVVRDDPIDTAPPEQIQAALVDGIRDVGLGALPWSEAAERLRARLTFLHHHDAEWPDVSDQALLATLDEWLLPVAGGVRRLADLARIDLVAPLHQRIPGRLRGRLDALAPERLAVPSGSRIAIDYSDPEAPVLAVRLQEVFGLSATPTILAGRVPLTLHLLSPAGRPVQVTRDLASFWATGYFDVRRDLRGRYPRHRWPDDPTQAEPGLRRR